MKKKNIQTSSNKSFGIVFFLVFFIVGVYPLLNQGEIRIWSIIISIIFLFLGIFNSKILTPFNKFWVKFGIILGKFVSPIILGLIFFFVVLPTGLIMRMIKKNFLGVKFDKNLKTYWVKKEKQLSSMKDQF